MGKFFSKTFPSLFLMVFSALTSNLAYGIFNLPPLKTMDQKLALLLRLKEEIPTLFSDAAKHDIDLFTLLDIVMFET